MRRGDHPAMMAALAVLAMILAVGLGGLPKVTAAPAAAGDPAKGAYLARLADCASCHGENFAGQRPGGPTSLPAAAPFGISFSLAGGADKVSAANITPDQETGIGNWSDQEIMRAVREGVRPDGKVLHPIMQYNPFHGIPDSEMEHIATFLRSLPPVKNSPPKRELRAEPATPRFAVPSPASSPAESPGRGNILVNNVARCSFCHTPTLPDRRPDPAKQLAGNILRGGPEPEVVANITPDEETGIGDWSVEQIAFALKFGLRPNGTEIKGAMKTQIKERFQFLSDTDARSIALYLKSIPPVENRPDEGLAPAPAPEAPATLPRTGESVSWTLLAKLLAGIGGLALALGLMARRRGKAY